MLIALAGVTCGGKTSVAEELSRRFSADGDNSLKIVLLRQDDYYKETEQLTPISDLGYWNFDVPSAVDFDRLVADCKEIKQRDNNTIVLVDGNMVLESPDTAAIFQLSYFFLLDYSTCNERRRRRCYEPPDVPGYFDQYVWPSYEQHLRQMHLKPSAKRPHFLDSFRLSVAQMADRIEVSIRQHISRDWVLLTTDELDVAAAQRFVTGPQDGAASIFVGTTRDNFGNKFVVRLEYEAYDGMAYDQMRRLCQLLRSKYQSVDRVAIFHRLGVVAVGEASVVVAVSSPHRKDAQLSTQFAIDELKRTVPIWKKEIYADESSSWKENCECGWQTQDT